MRIQKYLSQHSTLSRRKVEQMIRDKRLVVNQEPAHIGQSVQNGDVIEINHKKLTVHLATQAQRVGMLNKPLGVICSQVDPKGREIAHAYFPKEKDRHWILVGRLDVNTSGLLLCTTDGELANQLMHPRYRLKRTYRVRVFGACSPEQRAQLTQGIDLDGTRCVFESCIPISPEKTDGMNQWYEVTVTSGKYRMVRRMWQAIGVEVSRLVRVAYGPIRLPKTMGVGHYRDLTPGEINQLKKAIHHNDSF